MEKNPLNSEVENDEKIKNELKKIFQRLGEVNELNLGDLVDEYEVSFGEILVRQCQANGISFAKYDAIESDLREMYKHNDISQDEKWKKIREQKKDPDYQKFLDIKRNINKISSELLASDQNLSSYRDKLIEMIEYRKDGVKFEENHGVLFRSVKNSDMKKDFERGMHPQVLGLEIYQDTYNFPFVNDSAITQDPEVIGHTGGIISCTSSIDAAIRFSNSRAHDGFNIYMVAPRKVLNIGNCIHRGSGYSGDGEGNIEALEEFGATKIAGDEILAARFVHPDGRIDSIKVNDSSRSVQESVISGKEFMKYMNFNHVDDFKIAEFLENGQTFEKIYGENGVKWAEDKIFKLSNGDKSDKDRLKKITEISLGMTSDEMREKFNFSKAENRESQGRRYSESRDEAIKAVDKKIEDYMGINNKACNDSAPKDISNMGRIIDKFNDVYNNALKNAVNLFNDGMNGFRKDSNSNNHSHNQRPQSCQKKPDMRDK